MSDSINKLTWHMLRPAKLDRPRCGARCRSKAGAPCVAPVWRQPNGTLAKRCRMHGGLSTGPKTEEGRARAWEAVLRRWARYRTAREQTPARPNVGERESLPSPGGAMGTA